jgi:hypothetical protein
MEKLKTTFLVCVLAGVTGCFLISDEPPEPPTLEPFYVNNSGITVRLTYDNIIHTQKIENNDTLCNQYLDERCSNPYWFVTHGYEGDLYISAYFKIEFLTEPKVCLVFDGDDKVENDIRYWENYTFIKEKFTSHHYSYTITPEHKAMAKEENCQSSASE